MTAPISMSLAATSGWYMGRGVTYDLGSGTWRQPSIGYYDPAGGSDGATPCFVTLQYNNADPTAATQWRVAEWKLSDGSLSRSTVLAADPTAATGITRIGSSWYVTAWNAGAPTILKIARADGSTTSTTAAAKFYSTWPAMAIKTDGTYLYLVGWATSYLTLRYAKFDSTPAYVSSTTLALPSAPTGADNVGLTDLERCDTGDGNGSCLWVGLEWVKSADFTIKGTVGQTYQFKVSDGSLVAGTDWLPVITTDSHLQPSSCGMMWLGYWSEADSVLWAIESYLGNMGTLTIDTGSAPSVTFSWSACPNGATTDYMVEACQKVANAYAGSDHNNPNLDGHAVLARVAYGTNQATVNLSGRLQPGDWVVQVHAGYWDPNAQVSVSFRSTPEGAVDLTGLTSWHETGYSSIGTLTIACPSPYANPEFYFNASGTLYYKTSFHDWYVASVWQATNPFNTRFPGAVQIS